MNAFLAAFDAIPEGASDGTYQGRRWRIAKTLYAGGKSVKLVAEALDGGDYVSLNLYRTARGAALRPCEMPAAKVMAFVAGVEIMQAP